MTQINTPYPATAYLTGFLRSRGFDVEQRDLSLELFLALFSEKGLRLVAAELAAKKAKLATPAIKFFTANQEAYFQTIDSVILFLQEKDSFLAHRILQDGFLPRGPRFGQLKVLNDALLEDPFTWAFGPAAIQDPAKYLASLYVDDLADVIREGIDPRFELSRYAEKLSASEPSFDPILKALSAAPTLVDRLLDEVTLKVLDEVQPDVIGLTAPFPGNVYGAFRIAQVARRNLPKVQVVLGGGYVNTELRDLTDARVFDFLDYLTFDDGERPFLSILESVQTGKKDGLVRTWGRENGEIRKWHNPLNHDIPFRDSGTPTYDGLSLKNYVGLCELLNPMHRLWSDGRWNKLTLAHGCYWKKCSFCDLSLDYIGRYEVQPADLIVDRIEALIVETGQRGFHFVDEAAPPKVLAAMAERLIARKVKISWWGNIRFEKAFTPELTDLLARSGCIAVSGGLEVASDRLLKLMEKGVTVEQVAQVTHHFTQSGVMVHAYLMFGFPTQTIQETVDSLERVRQLFAAGCLQSAFWHRFSATAHSPVGKSPDTYGIRLLPNETSFARNDLPFEDKTGIDHGLFHAGLKKAVYNFMHGIGLEEDVRSWFEFPVPKAKVSPKLIQNAILSVHKGSTQA